MSEAENKAFVRRVTDELFNKRSVDAVSDFFAPELIPHILPPGMSCDRDGFKQLVAALVGAVDCSEGGGAGPGPPATVVTGRSTPAGSAALVGYDGPSRSSPRGTRRVPGSSTPPCLRTMPTPEPRSGRPIPT